MIGKNEEALDSRKKQGPDNDDKTATPLSPELCCPAPGTVPARIQPPNCRRNTVPLRATPYTCPGRAAPSLPVVVYLVYGRCSRPSKVPEQLDRDDIERTNHLSLSLVSYFLSPLGDFDRPFSLRPRGNLRVVTREPYQIPFRFLPPPFTSWPCFDLLCAEVGFVIAVLRSPPCGIMTSFQPVVLHCFHPCPNVHVVPSHFHSLPMLRFLLWPFETVLDGRWGPGTLTHVDAHTHTHTHIKQTRRLHQASNFCVGSRSWITRIAYTKKNIIQHCSFVQRPS
ncbi:uncharacterized protein LY79DRAFT_154342 [Colletotrichum navitas]|uniref:Uncharacterized protein n=1 Tax=Colletotrichum navitas TaxID=681940 RepID=A0AAD8Q2K0_9PEZI|nr:uncharacterized protein LY79DRAFT_154342 [Colletotrichum navitas]KAK1594354.1 hypothetical protein LY79DRAFT_154342 [Colletotrichum navitas]